MIMIDMPMPENCSECRFETECGYCKAMPDNFCGYTDEVERPKWCPLKEQEYGWISVYDQLPEIGAVVLALGKKTSSTGVFQGTSRADRPDLWWWKGHIIREATHWMHLPEPPKDGR